MIELINVTKKYAEEKKESVVALNSITLSLPDKGLVVITGTSGCGKTTLLNILGGLDRPTDGEVRLNDIRIDDKDEKWWDSYRSSCLGFIYQDFNLLENMTVKENIRLPLALQNMDEADINKSIINVSDELGLNELLDKQCSRLSGGQKQRVAIARAIIMGAKIILADEPTGNLDKANSDNVFKLLKDISQKCLVVVVTHDVTLAVEYADRLISLSYGIVEEDKVINCNENNSEEISDSISEKKRSLSVKECMRFAFDAIKKRKGRCIISTSIFCITMLLVLLLCEAVFRKDSISVAADVKDKNLKLLQLYTDVPDEYVNIAPDDEVVCGEKFYELISRQVEQDRIIRCGEICDIYTEDEGYLRSLKVYAGQDSAKYMDYEGKYPEKSNEIMVSQKVANCIIKSKNPIGDKITIDEKEYLITGIVKTLCGKDIESIYIDDGTDDDLFENIILFNSDFLADGNDDSPIYMNGFGVTLQSNVYFQTSIYDYVASANNISELIAGRLPEKDNEILISKSTLDIREQTEEMVLNKKCKIYDLYEDKYGCTYWNSINLYDYLGGELTIVGVADGKSEYYLSDSVYKKIQTAYNQYCDQAYCLIYDEKYFTDDITGLQKKNIFLRDKRYDKLYSFISTIDSIKIGMLIGVFTIALLAVLQMISLFSYSINDNKKTIGILRTLGVDKSDTKKIFTVECVVISVIALVSAIIISLVITYFINDYVARNLIEIDKFRFFRMRPVVVLITGIVSILLSILSVIIPLRKYSKIKIIDLIK